MRSGALRHRVTVQQLVAGSPQQKPTGEPDTSWVDYCTVWASIDPVLGREYFAADQIQSDVDTKIRMRYEVGVNDEITAAMRVVHGAVLYNIKTPINVNQRGVEWLLYCATGLNEG